MKQTNSVLPVPLPSKDKVAKRINRKTAIKKAELYLKRNLPLYIQQLEKLAVGVLVQTLNKDGEEEIYRTPPDREALKYLINRAGGTPPTRVELTQDEESKQGVAILPWIAIAPQKEEEQGELLEGEAREVD